MPIFVMLQLCLLSFFILIIIRCIVIFMHVTLLHAHVSSSSLPSFFLHVFFQMTFFPPPLMFIYFLVIILHALYLSIKFLSFWSCLGWVQKGSNLNLIQIWIIFVSLKMPKEIYSNAAQNSELH